MLRAPAAAGLLTGVLAAAVIALVTPTPAAAAVPGLQYASATTGFDSVVYKAVTVSCPSSSQVVIGGGYSLEGADGSVVLDDFIPSTNSLRVGAGEVVGPGEPSDGTTANWRVVATVVCASPPPGWQIVSQTSPFMHSGSAETAANCPAGTRAIGAGASLANGWGQISIKSLHFSSTAVFARAIEDEDGYSGSWSITAYAICANPLPGMQVIRGFSAFDSASPKLATADCPFGQVVVGLGWGLSAEEQVLNTAAEITIGGTGATVIGAEDSTGFNSNWQVGSELMCADG